MAGAAGKGQPPTFADALHQASQSLASAIMAPDATEQQRQQVAGLIGGLSKLANPGAPPAAGPQMQPGGAPPGAMAGGGTNLRQLMGGGGAAPPSAGMGGGPTPSGMSASDLAG